jgi:hypothetical protein
MPKWHFGEEYWAHHHPVMDHRPRSDLEQQNPKAQLLIEPEQGYQLPLTKSYLQIPGPVPGKP